MAPDPPRRAAMAPRPHRPRATAGLRRRIVGLLLLVSLLPLTLLGVGAWTVFGRLTLEQTIEVQRRRVAAHAATIDLFLQERRRALAQLAATHAPEALRRPGELSRLLRLLGELYPGDFVDLGVIHRDGRHLAYQGPYDLASRNYAGARWFKDTLAQGSTISDIFLGFRRVPHFIIAVSRGRAEGRWILRATVSSARFGALVQQGSFGHTGRAYLVDRAGRYQSPPEGAAALAQSPLRNPSAHPGVRTSRVAAGGEALVRLTTWVNGGAWLLVVEQQAAEITAPVDRALLIGALFVLLAVGLVVAVTVLSTAHLVGRIEATTGQRDALSRDLMRSARLASIGELATGLAHEINNPLAILSAEQTNITDLLGECDLPAEARAELEQTLGRCRRQVSRCGAITAKMLQFGRQQESEPRPSDLPRLVEETVALLERQARLRNVDLVVEAAPDLPRAVVDPTELQQVLVNLINNALQATPAGGAITVALSREGRGLRLSVSDTGSGIPAEVLERVFEPFFTTKPVGQGTGLGLAVCYGLVRGWGGTIEAQSSPGQGTTMVIRLPGAEQSERRAG